jgi:hypothetical protein
MNSTGNHLSPPEGRGREDVNASTDLPKVLRQTAPYKQSMRDLYTQIPEQTARLKRFGSEVFLDRDSSAVARGNLNHDIPSMFHWDRTMW